MKNLSYVINGVLALGVIVLFILHFTSKNKTEDGPSLKFENDSTVSLPIAYVNVDTILTQYTYAKDVRDLLMTKSENSSATINQKQRQFATAQEDFQKKYQSNAFLSQERAEQEYQRLQKMGADMEQLAGRLRNELDMEQLKYNNQLADSVQVCIAEFNKKSNYQMILSNTGMNNVLYAQKKYDITDQILKLLNSRYVPEKK